MKLEKVEEDNGVLTVKLEDSNEAVANSLRRAMMARVPTLAVKHIDVVKNESGLFDEILANRIGQVPWTIPQKFDEEDELHLALKQEGPTSVTAENMQADNDEAEPVHDALIVELKEDQDIELEATAVLQNGRDHAKHQGGTVGYEKLGDGEFQFRIESTSGYTNEELLQKAIEVVQEELENAEASADEL
ncbi:hypothetical protein [Candidatus Nanohalovita haloferacivicina]|uniref:hypothetical protein n=1 Tax=Candidatus Nanohalovita haloferacivicina TaxID=2978046 RepID=UPI00325FB532|nr:DNA-directed RNA polymerase subunit D [Candidatus Nanohalobia archaeon BNXNv]